MPKALSADQVADVAAYYTNANAEFLPLAGGNTEFIDMGRQLARIGDAAKDIQARNNCHRPDRAAISPAITYLAGQYSQYIVFELQMWTRGFRKSSPDVTALIAKKFDDQQMAAVATFYRGSRRYRCLRV